MSTSQYITYPVLSGGLGNIISINGDSTGIQTLVTATTGTDFTITNNSAGVNTFAIPSASATNRGLLTSGDWSTFSAKQSALTFTAPIVNTSGTVAMAIASGSVDGYLTSANFNIFNGKQSALTIGNISDAGTDGITVTGGTGAIIGAGVTLSQHVADATHNGYLASGDWSTFNSKQSTLTLGNITDAGTDGITITGGTGAIIGSGVTISQHVADTTHSGYLSSTDWNTFNGKATSALTNTHIFVGNASNIATDVQMGGDATIANNGQLSLATITSSQTVGDTNNWTIVSTDAKGRVTTLGTRTIKLPTIQRFTTAGSATYTVPNPPPFYITVEIVGAGGGGGGATTGTATAGSATTFDGSNLSAGGGGAGMPNNGVPASGGAASISGGSWTTLIAVGGSAGNPSGVNNTAPGGSGGNSFLGGAGYGANANGGAGQPGQAAATNSGSGGGGGSSSLSSGGAGSGGGAGAYIKVQSSGTLAALSTFSVVVGTGGSGGAGNGTTSGPGSTGGDGIVIVTQHFQ